MISNTIKEGSIEKFVYRIFFYVFTVNTDYFTGDRFEVITITKDIITHKLSFVILDYYTNSITWDQ